MRTQVERVVIINDRSTSVGGASSLAILAADLLCDRGLEIVFCCGDGAEALAEKRFKIVAIGGEPLVQQPRRAAFASGLYNPVSFNKLRQWIEQNDSAGTVYHLHGWSKILSPSIFRALHPVRHRVILHAHDYFLVCPNGGFTDFKRYVKCDLKPLSMSCLTTQCDKRNYSQKLWRCTRQMMRGWYFDYREAGTPIIMIHDRMAPFFERSGVPPEQLCTIRNPVELLSRDEMRPWENKAFFFIGRLEPEKGFEEAAEAARRAGVTLRVLGDGPGRQLLERRYPEVQIRGWKSKSEMARELCEARAAVISSRVPEPFGLAAIEALAVGIPIVITDHALLADEVVSLGMGAKYRANDLEDCTRALRWLAKSDATIIDMSRNAIQLARSLATTQDEWRDALIERYDMLLAR